MRATCAMKSCSVCCVNLLGTRGRIGDTLAAFCRGFRIHWSSRSSCGVRAAVKRKKCGRHERDYFAGRTLVMLEPLRTIWRLFLGIRKRSADCGALLPLGFSSFRSGYALACIAELGRNWNDFSRRSLDIRQRIYCRLKECGNGFGRRVREVVQRCVMVQEIACERRF